MQLDDGRGALGTLRGADDLRAGGAGLGGLPALRPDRRGPHLLRRRDSTSSTLGRAGLRDRARAQVEAGEEETAWFERHGSTPITELPDDWPDDYRALVQRRLELIESDPAIRLLEKPEYKRRWAVDAVGRAAHRGACRRRSSTGLSSPSCGATRRGRSPGRSPSWPTLLQGDAVLRELVAVLTGDAEADLAKVLASLVTEEAVPYLAAHRYKPAGLEKFRTWQQVWDLQRREDAGEKVDIPVPPKYSTPDFRKVEYWKARGKLDVPKERFILYPDLHREGDSTPVLGWAGWDHKDQALALGAGVPDPGRARRGRRPADPDGCRSGGARAVGPPVALRDGCLVRREPRSSDHWRHRPAARPTRSHT